MGSYLSLNPLVISNSEMACSLRRRIESGRVKHIPPPPSNSLPVLRGAYNRPEFITIIAYTANRFPTPTHHNVRVQHEKSWLGVAGERRPPRSRSVSHKSLDPVCCFGVGKGICQLLDSDVACVSICWPQSLLFSLFVSGLCGCARPF